MKHTVLKGILSIIRDISDPEFQQKAWIDRKVHEYCSFEETMHHFFDDYEAKEMVANYEDYGISLDQYKILLEFYELLDAYTDKHMSWDFTVDPNLILSDPEWHKIQKKAKEVLKAFDYKEKRVLKE